MALAWPVQFADWIRRFLWLIAILKVLEFGISAGVSGADRGGAAGFDRLDCDLSVGSA